MQERISYNKLDPVVAASMKEGYIFFKLSDEESFSKLKYYHKQEMINHLEKLIEEYKVDDPKRKFKLDVLKTISRLVYIESNLTTTDYSNTALVDKYRGFIDEIPDILKFSIDYDMIFNEKDITGMKLQSSILDMAFSKAAQYVFENDYVDINNYTYAIMRNLIRQLADYRRRFYDSLKFEFAVRDLKKLVLDLERLTISAYIRNTNLTLFEEDIPFVI